MLGVLMSGDKARCEELANNILQTRGISREDAVSQARRFFGV